MKKTMISVLLAIAVSTGIFMPSITHAQSLNNIYTVAAGDTLWGISKTTNVSIDNLKKYNSLTTDTLRIGQTLKLSITHTVASGDTLWLISRKYATTVDNILNLNKLTSSSLSIGQVLLIEGVMLPSPVQPTTPIVTPPIVTAPQNIAHTVVSGDTLWMLSVKYSTSVDTLMKLNNLTTSSLKIGQVLLISGSMPTTPIDSTVPIPVPVPTPVPAPGPVIETVNYKVIAGDNLWTLAQKYKTSVDAIMKSNMLIVDYVMPNQILTIPVNSTAIVKPVGITMMSARINNNFGDIYTWENAMRIWTVGTKGTIKDIATGKSFSIVYYGGSNHSDIEPLTIEDTNIMKSIYGSWSWNNSHKRPMVLTFTKGGVDYQMAVSLTGMPHGTYNITDNGFNGHTDMYFYNSLGHSETTIDPVHQANIFKANGQ
jgi:LysM repeat protein